MEKKKFDLPFEDRKQMILHFWDKLIPYFPSIQDKVDLVVSEEPDEDDEHTTGRYWKTKKQIIMHPMSLKPHFNMYEGNVYKFYSKLLIILVHEIRHAVWDFSDVYREKVEEHLEHYIRSQIHNDKKNVVRLKGNSFIITYREIIEADARCFSIKWVLEHLEDIRKDIYPEFDTDPLLIEISRAFTHIYNFPKDVRPEPITHFAENHKEKMLALVKVMTEKNWFDIFKNINWDGLKESL